MIKRVDQHLLGFIVFTRSDSEIIQVDYPRPGLTWFTENGEIVVDTFDNNNQWINRWRKPIDDVGANRGNFLSGIR